MSCAWREHALTGDWHLINEEDVSKDDLPHLLDMLRAEVPERLVGHGVEVSWGYLSAVEVVDVYLGVHPESENYDIPYDSQGRPDERAMNRDYRAARALERFQAIDSENGPKRPFGEIFKPAVEAAIETARENGIVYNGMDDTYIVRRWDRSFRSLPPRRGRILHEKKLMVLQESSPQEALAWLRQYPWRGLETLNRAWEMGAFERNSPIDHALHILNENRLLGDWLVIARTPQRYRSTGVGNSGFRALLAMKIADAGFRIGRHFEALRNKPVEAHARVRLDQIDENRRNGAKGGQASQKQERYRVLNDLARSNEAKFRFVSGSQAIRAAKKLALEYDKVASDPLFQHRGSNLSLAWYGDWWDQFRTDMQQLTNKK